MSTPWLRSGSLVASSARARKFSTRGGSISTSRSTSGSSLPEPWSMERKQSNQHWCTFFTCVTTMDSEKKQDNVANKVTDKDPREADRIWFPIIIPNSSHRDGAIYDNTILAGDWIDFDFTDRNETLLEPMMFSKATGVCLIHVEDCIHFPTHMFQFFLLKLVECHMSNGPIQIYGYIATRDIRDGMLNCVFNHRRDDPFIVQQGSLIEMTGPKRGIAYDGPILMEFDMRIKNGEREEEDLELIDGAIICEHHRARRPIKYRINGNCGAVDMSIAYIEDAVEATIEVVVSEVHYDFSLSLSSFVSVVEQYEEILLFKGIINQSHELRRFVVAATWGTVMLLKFKLGNTEVLRSFQAKLHGCSTHQMKLECASVSLKVTWSTI
ncbi:hypothetical protein ACP70R_022349 [Stipagrostis hirtigluma subsp. patula]